MKTINSVEAYNQHKELELFFIHSDFIGGINKQIADLDALLNNCPEQWVAENIKRSIVNLVGIKQDIELAYKRSIEINETPFVDECGKYFHSN